MRVIVADDHPLILEGITGMLRTAGHVIVGACENGRALLKLLQQEPVDAVTLDIGMPGANGIEVARQIAAIRPAIKIIIVSQQTGSVYVRSAFQAGVSGFVAKQSSSRELLLALETVKRGRNYVTPGLLDEDRGTATTIDSALTRKRSSLTQRQREVLLLIAEGKTAKEAATALSISAKTVEFHKQALMRGLNLRTTAELTRYAIAEGLSPL